MVTVRSDARPGQLPGDGSMWVFVLGDLIIFSAYFVIFLVHRAQQPELFAASQQQLSPGIGVVNTLVLITSSWFVARGVQAARAADYRGAVRMIGCGAVCGMVFTAIKAYEWSSEIRAGLTFPHDDFFMFYYLLTGVHLFHVLLGLVILAVVMANVRTGAPPRIATTEAGAIYWHMVDLLWVVIFALLYLLA